MIELTTAVSELNRIGKATATKLKKIGITNAWDLLWHLPRDYQDFSNIKKIKDLKVQESATVIGKIELINSRRSRLKRMNITECLLTDETGSIKIIWFNQPYLTKQLVSGDKILVAGKITDDYFTLQFTNPLWEKYKEDTIHTARLVPIYPLTQGLTQKQLRFLIKQVTHLTKKITDYIPNEIQNKYSLLPLSLALEYIHWPKNMNDWQEAKRRLKFDELLILQLLQEKSKLELINSKSPQIPFQQEMIKKLVSQLPFRLTDDQRRSAWEILQNINSNHPMNRLLQGDVGSGKTVVAAIASLNTALNKYQTAIIAPTEILAFQHWQTFKETLADFNIPIALLTRSQRAVTYSDKKISKKKIIDAISQGEVAITIGTHALLQEKIKFKNLSLIIIDEQHRFGVKQRAQLKEQHQELIPHFLSMTATPIPRSLALTLYGDLDISIIREKPPGRKPIVTKLVAAENRDEAYNFIKQKLNSGEQAFVICPLIEESDKLGVKAAETEYHKLSKNIFPEFRIGLLHGKMKAADKQAAMNNFANHKLDILVSTAVVEVGVDVPNATIMIIEGSERFGLAQLHQFRGRVGRSHQQSFCLLFTDKQDSNTTNRLTQLTQTNDGLKLAEFDLKIRGAGDVYGTKQSGFIELKIATLYDLDIIKQAKTAAKDLLKTSPDLSKYPLLSKHFNQSSKKIHWE